MMAIIVILILKYKALYILFSVQIFLVIERKQCQPSYCYFAIIYLDPSVGKFKLEQNIGFSTYFLICHQLHLYLPSTLLIYAILDLCRMKTRYKVPCKIYKIATKAATYNVLFFKCHCNSVKVQVVLTMPNIFFPS